MTRWIVFLVVALVIAVFAVENARAVPVHILFWTVARMSLSVLILVAALVGAVVGVVGSLLDARRRERAVATGLRRPPVVEPGKPEEPPDGASGIR